MEMISKIFFFVSVFIIVWANGGYYLSLKLIDRTLNKKSDCREDYFPSVTVMVVAHNEEKVILKKLNNLNSLNYPKEKLKVIVSSDNSTDMTNKIVTDFISSKHNFQFRLFEVTNRKGKTNAQNEAQKIVDTEFLVMTDANAMLDPNSIKYLMSSFIDSDIAYVTGKLIYTNNNQSHTSKNESFYWKMDLDMREIESRIKTITAGNGALYAVRNSDYFDFDPIESHDSAMPTLYALSGRKAIANHLALAYEKAGESNEDEFNRKVRMNRVLLSHILPDIRILNFFKYGWYTYFYLGHRTSRYLLWIAHLLLLITNIILALSIPIFRLILILHIFVLFLGLVQSIFNFKNKLVQMIYYYLMTIMAQYVGIWRVVTGKSKPFWEKAESTR